MRTVKRLAEPLNAGKLASLEAVRSAYAHEKQHWLNEFQKVDNRARIKRHRQVRDEALRAGYLPATALPARLWKLALVEAAETMDKYWQALFVDIRSRAGKNRSFSDDQRHYLNSLLKNYASFFQAISGVLPAFKPSLTDQQKHQVVRWLNRAVGSLKGHLPSVKNQRSVALDADCYTVFKEGSTQYLKVMTLVRGQRAIIPLKGDAAISGNIRLVFKPSGVEVHVSQGLKVNSIGTGVIEAIDFGYTEAFTGTDGVAYGDQLGVIITDASNTRDRVGKARNKLRALAVKYAASRNPKHRKKARNLNRCNLGMKKWHRREGKARAAIACEINHGLNVLIREKQPSVLVSEDLRQAFTFDKPRSWNRKLSAWVRGVLQDRVAFKGLAKGFRHEAVNPAYGSQMCPACGFVEKTNRRGDTFLCLHCSHADQSDRVAAINYLHRYGDPEITRFTPYRVVKTMLMERFHRRLETAKAVTVPGRTPDTEPSAPRRKATRKRQQEGIQLPLKPVGQSESETQRLHLIM